MAQLILDLKEIVREQIDFRELLIRLAARDLLLRYKQTAMGIGWALFAPLVNTAVFAVIFTQVAPIKTPVPYPLFAYSGLWAWNFFASSLRFAVGSLTSNHNLVSKVYFPREMLPFSAIGVCLVDFAVGSVVLVGLMIYYHVGPTRTIVFLPAVLVLEILFAAAVSLTVAMANLFYRDVKYIFDLVLSVWMFATSVLYPLDALHGKLAVVARLNPMTALINAYRCVLFGLPLTDPIGLAVAAFLAVSGLGVAWIVFHRAEFRFAENL